MKKIWKQKNFEEMKLPKKGEDIIIELLFNSVLKDKNKNASEPSLKK